MYKQRNNCQKLPTGDYIGVFLKWTDGRPARNIEVQIDSHNGQLANKKFTNGNGFVQLSNKNQFHVESIYIDQDKYEKKMENGKYYTFYLNSASNFFY